MNNEIEKYNNAVLNRFKNMTADQKLNLSLKLYSSARDLKAAALKEFYPELSKKQIEKKVREIFFYAGS
jgi:hypothetical protein